MRMTSLGRARKGMSARETSFPYFAFGGVDSGGYAGFCLSYF